MDMQNRTASADMPAKKAADGTLTNTAGMTLYTFDKDSAGKSACNGPCATNWPPLMAGSSAKASGDWSVVKRDDGPQAVGLQGQAALHMDQGPEAGRQDGRRCREQRLAYREGLRPTISARQAA